MFRMWGKLVQNHRIVRDTTSVNADYRLSRTQMVLDSLEDICHTFDLPVPIWLKPNIEEFRRRSRTRFGPDCFIEQISFDYLEIQVIEE